MRDADALERAGGGETARARPKWRANTPRGSTRRVQAEELRRVGQQLTPDVKSRFILHDLDRVRNLYAKRLTSLKEACGAAANGAS